MKSGRRRHILHAYNKSLLVRKLRRKKKRGRVLRFTESDGGREREVAERKRKKEMLEIEWDRIGKMSVSSRARPNHPEL